MGCFLIHDHSVFLNKDKLFVSTIDGYIEISFIIKATRTYNYTPFDIYYKLKKPMLIATLYILIHF